MKDRVFESFLQQQFEEGMQLAGESDLLELTPLNGAHSQHYVATFHCKGLVCPQPGQVEEADLFRVGIFFPPDYLRRAETAEVLTWLGPANVFHPNIRCYELSTGLGLICGGRFPPGTRLVDLLYQCFEIITYNRVTMNENDALNHAACEWARRNRSRLPVDRRPLKSRHEEFKFQMVN